MKNLNDLILLQEYELLEELGLELSLHQAIPRSPHELRTIAQLWLNNNINHFQSVLCSSKEIYSMVENNSDFKEIILAICDLLISLQYGVSPLTVAVLIAKKGLRNLCKNNWTQLGDSECEK
jgi:hypothetical protein